MKKNSQQLKPWADKDLIHHEFSNSRELQNPKNWLSNKDQLRSKSDQVFAL